MMRTQVKGHRNVTAAILLMIFYSSNALVSSRRRDLRYISKSKGGVNLNDFRKSSFSNLPSQSELKARPRRRYAEDEEDEEEFIRQRLPERPTQTAFDVDGPKMIPPKPKIVVLGATGRVGRLVVKQLMRMKSVDMTVVALVRDTDKATRVLNDEMVVARSSRGPTLEIIEGDLVPPEELPGFKEDADEEEAWMEKAESASRFYGNEINEYDNRSELPDVNEALEEAIRDCTTIISCVGSVRPTNLWTDILARPFARILRADVSRWCQDARHPYYVHYASTRKALGFAEREQLRREAVAMTVAEEEDLDLDEIQVPKIRFIRVSDLCVGHKPWHFVPLVTNIIHSVVFRYQEMAEHLLEQSNHLETIVVRPGDLVDEERDTNTTSIQVSHTGTVPSPARVGRDDVASLLVSAAMLKSKNQTSSAADPAFHYTLACRWVGEDMGPYPSQGRKGDGLSDPGLALQRTIKTIEKAEKRSRRRREALKRKSRQSTGSVRSDMIIRMANKMQRRRLKPRPHGICVAACVYLFLGLSARTLLYPIIHKVPGAEAFILPFFDRINRMILDVTSILFIWLKSVLPVIGKRKRYIAF